MYITILKKKVSVMLVKICLDDDFDKLLINDMQNDVFNHKYDLHLRRSSQPQLKAGKKKGSSYINDYYELKSEDLFNLNREKRR